MKYAFKIEEKAARAALLDMAISTKDSIEICNKLRKMTVDKAIAFLERVVIKKEAVPFKRFTNGAGHKSGIGPGKYPIKASESFLSLLKLAKSNAIDKGLSEKLKVSTILAQKASTPWKYGRQRRRKAKRTHLQIQVTEIKK
jgi:large subunit ribosomal protein L22